MLSIRVGNYALEKEVEKENQEGRGDKTTCKLQVACAKRSNYIYPATESQSSNKMDIFVLKIKVYIPSTLSLLGIKNGIGIAFLAFQARPILVLPSVPR